MSTYSTQLVRPNDYFFSLTTSFASLVFHVDRHICSLHRFSDAPNLYRHLLVKQNNAKFNDYLPFFISATTTQFDNSM